MTIDQSSAEGDLAFMRALLSEHSGYDRSLGINYLAAGLLYGFQCLANAILLIFEINAPTLVWLAIGILPTVLFIAVNATTVWQNKAQPFGTGTAKRALGGAFAMAGIATLVLACIFGIVALQRGDWTIWFLFPIVVCALQGAIWGLATILRRRKWYGLIAFGWLASPFALVAAIDQPAIYVLILGVVLVCFMGLPGAALLKDRTRRS